MIKKESIELQLLSGIPIRIEGLKEVHTPKLREIAQVGEEVYQLYLYLCTLDPSEIVGKNDRFYEEYTSLNTYEFLLLQSTYSYLNGDNSNIKSIVDAISFFLKTDVKFYLNEKEEPLLYLEDDLGKIIEFTSEKYEKFKCIVKIQNWLELEKKNKIEFNPKNKKAKEVADKIKKAREKIKKLKSSNSNNEDITLADLISIFSSHPKSKINILEVWDLDIYQFNDQFQRMRINEEYEIGIQSLLHGADPKETKIKNIFTKINK